MEPDESLTALRSGDADIAITHTYSSMEPVDSRNPSIWPLRTESVWLAVPSGRHVTGPVDLQQFAADDWLVPRRERSCHDMVVRACGAAGFALRVTAEATDIAVLLALVNVGAGVALVPELAIDRLPAGVRLMPLDRPVDRHLFLAARAASAADPSLARLREAIVRASSTLVSDWSRSGH